MDSSEYAHLLKYSSPDSMLVITYNNELVELICPFQVEVIRGVGDFSKGSIRTVDMVKVSISLITVYVIEDNLYFFYHFDITI